MIKRNEESQIFGTDYISLKLVLFFRLFTACIYRGSRTRAAWCWSRIHPPPQPQATPSCTCRIGYTNKVFVYLYVTKTCWQNTLGRITAGLLESPSKISNTTSIDILTLSPSFPPLLLSCPSSARQISSSCPPGVKRSSISAAQAVGKNIVRLSSCLTSRPSSPGSTPRWKRVGASKVGGASKGACAWGGK